MTIMMALLAFLGGAVGPLALLLYQHLNRRRLRLGYELLSAAPLVPFETKAGDPLRVMVKKELLLADLRQSGEDDYQDAGKVYGFRVLLRNTGTETIKGDNHAPGVDIIFGLDASANVLAIDVEAPALSPDDFAKEEHYQGMPNIARLWLKYLNKGRDVIVSIQSVRNADLTCNVDARAPDLAPAYDMEEAHQRSSWITLAILFCIGAIPLLVGVAWGISLYGVLMTEAEKAADAPRSTAIAALQLAGVVWLVASAVVASLIAAIQTRARRVRRQR